MSIYCSERQRVSEGVDWSLDKYKTYLREDIVGEELEIAQMIKMHDKFYREFGAGEYSHIRYVDWLIETDPQLVLDAHYELEKPDYD